MGEEETLEESTEAERVEVAGVEVGPETVGTVGEVVEVELRTAAEEAVSKTIGSSLEGNGEDEVSYPFVGELGAWKDSQAALKSGISLC